MENDLPLAPPTFVSRDGKRVIELLYLYLHQPEDEQKIIDRWAAKGIKCLVIWDYETEGDVESLKKKVLYFNNS